MPDLQKEYNELVDKINHYRHEYFVKNNSIISDAEYDKLFRKLLDMDADYPELRTKDSPTVQVGHKVEGSTMSHITPMLSLDNVFNLDELSDFLKRCYKKANDTPMYVDCKVDGVALDIIYKGGKFTAAITRGDGIEGQDVSENALTIANIPSHIGTKALVSIRGEVSAHKETFNAINNKREKEGLPLFTHVRNYASGSLMSKDPNVTRERMLKFYAWEIVSTTKLNIVDQMTILSSLGFSIPEGSLVTGLYEIDQYISKLSKSQNHLSYPIDGMVVKVNDYNVRKELGVNSRAPLWAVAWKFTDKGTKTTIRDVIWNVGRDGMFNPVGVLDPVNIEGSTIDRVNLHNGTYISKNKIGKGSEIYLIKRGDVIPKVKEVLTQGNVKDILPKKCPACGAETILHMNHPDDGGKLEISCSKGRECKGAFKSYLVYLVGKDVLNIKGIGPAFVDELIDKLNVSNLKDLFSPIVGSCEAQQILLDKLVNRVRNISVMELLMSLGIPGMGRAIASKLTSEVKTLEGLINTLDDESAYRRLQFPTYMKTQLSTWWAKDDHQKLLREIREMNLPGL